MNARSFALATGFAIVLTLIGSTGAGAAAAQRSDDSVREAGKHFQRGVTLYGETDYRGALIEFRRAYELAPNAAVLYNIGETEYQLRDYAGALTTFEKYLVDSSPGDSHRAEVEGSVRELKSRVGRITITTVPRGADVSIDERPLGKAFENPVTVGVGRVKVTATMAGRSPVTQYIDVAAEDDVSMLLQLPVAQSGRAADRAAAGVSQPADVAPSSSSGGASLRRMGWVATGVLGAGAVVLGVFAIREGSKLKSEREHYEDDGTNPSYARDKSARLDHLANLTRNYSLIADSLGAAAVVVGAVTLLSGLGSNAESSVPQVTLGYRSMSFTVTF